MTIDFKSIFKGPNLCGSGRVNDLGHASDLLSGAHGARPLTSEND